jgi:D-glycero-alpha-D-manno-heptose 1-phosphate guanylyltransferase
MTREAIILAGGKGTRLQEALPDVPKSLAPVNGKPFLEYQLEYLDRWGFGKVVLSVGYLREQIIKAIGTSYKSLSIEYSIEDEPLGTGGAVLKALHHIDSYLVFIFNGDTYFDVNLQRLYEFRQIKEADLCMTIRFENDTSRYGSVEFDNNNRIVKFHKKGEGPEEGYINGGIYLSRKDYLLKFGLPEKFSLEKDFFQQYYSTEEFYAMRCFSYFRDIGIPEDYQNAQDEFARFVF